MLSFSAPVWLIGLITIPLIWWLHKYHKAHKIVIVSTLLFWPKKTSDTQHGDLGNQTDYTWLLRAFIISLLFITLAQPYIQSMSEQIAIWVDNSKSMRTLESGLTRIKNAYMLVGDELQSRRNAVVTFRSISNPQHMLKLDRIDASSELQKTLMAWTENPIENHHFPASTAMSLNSEHWLITDGANTTIASWIHQSKIRKIIQVGTETENVSISNLTLRPSLIKTGMYKLMTVITNHGINPAQRKLSTTFSNSSSQEKIITIAAGKSLTVEHYIEPIRTGTIKAQIAPNDNLILDDILTLSLSNDVINAYISNSCPQHLITAVVAMPWLNLSGSGSEPHDISIGCNNHYDLKKTTPNIIFHMDNSSYPADGTPYWQENVGSLNHLFLDQSWLNVSQQTGNMPPDPVILQTQNQPLIAFANNKRNSINVWIDITTSKLTKRPEYPALIAGLVELALDKPIIKHSASAVNPISESNIAPQKLFQPDNKLLNTHAATTLDLSKILIVLGMFLLFIDLLMISKKKYRGTSNEYS